MDAPRVEGRGFSFREGLLLRCPSVSSYQIPTPQDSTKYWSWGELLSVSGPQSLGKSPLLVCALALRANRIAFALTRDRAANDPTRWDR